MWRSFAFLSGLCLALVDPLLGDDIKSAQVEKTFAIQGEVIDAVTKQPLAARVTVRSSNGTWYFPKSASAEGTAIEYRKQAASNSLEQHVTLSEHPFVVDVPPGRYTIIAERGKEYYPFQREAVVNTEPVSVKLPMQRWINMAEKGWYSGDVHAHRPLTEMPNLVMAEDLNVGMPLSHWVTEANKGPVSGNRIASPVPKAEWIAVDRTHGIYPLNTEYEIFTVGGKPHTLGAVLLLGQSTTLDQGVPPVRRIAEWAHRDGAFLDLEKHSWAWTPMIVPLMKPDLFELANNHCWPSPFAFHSWTLDAASKSMHLETNDQGFTEWGWIEFGMKSYYAYLNCGFRMMPSAGTGSGVHPVPLGFGRVYVHVDGDFTYQKWRDGLLAGHSFVTTGPMMQVTFNGEQAGHTFQTDAASHDVRIQGLISNMMPLDRIEILVNGTVVKDVHQPQIQPASRRPVVEKIDEMIRVEGTGWVAVRCFEKLHDGRLRFAHTAPVFVDRSGERPRPFNDEAQHFVERIEREIERHQGVLSPESLDEYQEALAIYRELLGRAVERPAPATNK